MICWETKSTFLCSVVYTEEVADTFSYAVKQCASESTHAFLCSVGSDAVYTCCLSVLLMQCCLYRRSSLSILTLFPTHINALLSVLKKSKCLMSFG
jgi:hypothetical protein